MLAYRVKQSPLPSIGRITFLGCRRGRTARAGVAGGCVLGGTAAAAGRRGRSKAPGDKGRHESALQVWIGPRRPSGHRDWAALGVRVVRVTPSRPFGSALGVAGARIWLKQKAHCHCVRRRWLPPYRPRRPGLAGQSTRLRRGQTAPGGLVAAAGVGRRAGGGVGRRSTGFPPCSTRGRAGSGIRARPRRLGAATCVRGRFLAEDGINAKFTKYAK